MPVPGLVYRHARCHRQTTQGLTPGPGDVGGASRERTGRSPGHPSPAGHEGLSRPMSVCVHAARTYSTYRWSPQRPPLAEKLCIQIRVFGTRSRSALAIDSINRPL